MLKRSLILAALLVPTAALAADQSPGDQSDGSEKSICEQIGINQFQCAQAFAICHWDPVDGRCEHNPGPSNCGDAFDPASCSAKPGCFWDMADPLGPRCESLG